MISKYLTGVCALALCGVATSTLAEPAASPAGAPAAPPGAVAEVIVTAQKRSERINDVPLSITALSSAQLAAHNITDASQLEKVVPGFTVQQSFLGQPVFFLRGVGYSDAAITTTPAVSVYADEAPLPFAAMSRGATLDLDRVEVLKGPQGTLFGQNSTGGAINFIAAKPTSTFQAGADATFGRFDEADVSGFVSGPLAENLSGRLALEHDSQSNWQDSISRPGDSRGAKDFTNGRLSLDWRPTDRLKVALTGQAWHDGSDMQAAQFVEAVPNIPVSPPADPGPLAALLAQKPAPNNARLADWDAGSPVARDETFYQVTLRGDYTISDAITLTSLTDYTHLKAFTPVDTDGTPYPNGFFRNYAKIDAVSQEFRLAGSAGPRLNWLLGANYAHQETHEAQDATAYTTNDAVTPFIYHAFDVYDNQKVDSYAAFGSLDYKLTDTLTVRGSARYTKENRSFDGCLADSGAGQLSEAFGFLSTVFSGSPATIAPGACVTLDDATAKPLPTVRQSLDQDNVSWRTGLDWKAFSHTLFYVTVAKGYKSGSFPAVAAVFASQFDPVTQESVIDYEGGFKTGLFDQRVQLNAAAFYYDYTNKQLLGYVNIEPFGNIYQLVNIPKSRIAGAEFDLTARLTQQLRLSVAGTYLDTKVQSNPPNPVCALTPPGQSCSFVGQPFPNTPKYQLTADLEQRFPLGDGREAYVGGNVLYHSATIGTFGVNGSAAALSAFAIPSYTLLDLRGGVSFHDGKWLVEVWGRNVTNTFYLTGVSRALEEISRYAGMPVTYGIRLRWRL